MQSVNHETQVFENKLDRDLEVYVEMYPDRYVLKPGDVMKITYERGTLEKGLHTIVWEDSLQIYLDNFDTAVVTINDAVVEPWSEE